MSVNSLPALPPAVPRDAATVVVVRDGPAGAAALEVLLLQRAERGDHNSGAWVFPGGLVDAVDRERGERALQHAALRECFEECGILLARDAAGAWPALSDAAQAEFAALRPRVAAGSLAIEAVCERFGLAPAYDTLHFIAHWLTPAGRAKRFDTRFFVAAVPRGQQALHDAGETTDHIWMTPAAALAPGHARRLMTPTRAVLQALAAFDSTAALLAWAAQPRPVERILPLLAMDHDGLRPVLPGEPAYDEVGKLDAAGRGQAWCVLRPGIDVALGARLVRVVDEAGRNHYRVDGVAVGGEPELVTEDRIVIEGERGEVPAALLAAADWLAPRRGFLRRVAGRPGQVRVHNRVPGTD
ncbi:MAG: NUDIX domain-containing protein [Rubrivivax sp.]|nr:NUDIX domain-containing protein [Rubrivivax sp.]